MHIFLMSMYKPQKPTTTKYEWMNLINNNLVSAILTFISQSFVLFSSSFFLSLSRSIITIII